MVDLSDGLLMGTYVVIFIIYGNGPYTLCHYFTPDNVDGGISHLMNSMH